MIIVYEVLFVLICGLLKWVGERLAHDAQRYVLPLVCCGMLYLKWGWAHPIIMFTPLLAIGVLVLGYKIYGRYDFWDRFFWLLNVEIFLWLGCLCSKHIHPLWVYLILLAVSALWGGFLRKPNNNWVAPITGAILGAIIFFIY